MPIGSVPIPVGKNINAPEVFAPEERSTTGASNAVSIWGQETTLEMAIISNGSVIKSTGFIAISTEAEDVVGITKLTHGVAPAVSRTIIYTDIA